MKIFKYLILFPVVALVLIGCDRQNNTGDNNTGQVTPTVASPTQDPEEIAEILEIIENETAQFSEIELESHDSADDCWVLLDNQIYDATPYLAMQDANQDLVDFCGQDATDFVVSNGIYDDVTGNGAYFVGELRQ